MLRYSCVVLLLAALLMLWCSEADAAPFFFSTNGTSILANLAETVLQQKINALEILADYIAIAGSASGTRPTRPAITA